MSYIDIARHPIGALWPDGKARMCVTCGSEVRQELRKRRRQAIVTANSRSASGTNLPVAWCEDHIPEGIAHPYVQ